MNIRHSISFFLVLALSTGCAEGPDPSVPDPVADPTTPGQSNGGSTSGPSPTDPAANSGVSPESPGTPGTEDPPPTDEEPTDPGDPSDPSDPEPTQWTALVANGKLGSDPASYSVLTFDGASASTTEPVQFGTGELVLASSNGRAFVADRNAGTIAVLDPDDKFEEIKQLQLPMGRIDALAANGDTLIAASGATRELVRYDFGRDGFAPAISVSQLSSEAFSMSLPAVLIDGSKAVGLAHESSSYGGQSMLYVAHLGSGEIEDLDASRPGTQGLGLGEFGGGRAIARLGSDSLAIGTGYDGIIKANNASGTWVFDGELIPKSQLGSGEVVDVVMADDSRGLAVMMHISGSPPFRALTFDAVAGTATQVDGLALPSSLVGLDASADGSLYFVGDYGIRNEPDKPWGIGIVEAETGALLDHVQPDSERPPTDVVTVP